MRLEALSSVSDAGWVVRQEDDWGDVDERDLV